MWFCRNRCCNGKDVWNGRWWKLGLKYSGDLVIVGVGGGSLFLISGRVRSLGGLGCLGFWLRVIDVGE